MVNHDKVDFFLTVFRLGDMVLDFPTDIWKNYDIDSRHKIRQRYGSTLAYQQRSFILCTASRVKSESLSLIVKVSL